MLKLRLVWLAEGMLTLGLCFVTATSSPLLAQTAPLSSSVPTEVRQYNQEIQKIIDRAEERFQAGEIHFDKGEYREARRAWDRAIDIILESGVDVRSDQRLQQCYQKLVDTVFQRQLALIKVSPAQPLPAAESTFSGSSVISQATQIPETTDAQNPKEKRGFGEQSYTASPLDELSKIKLTDDETKTASDKAAQEAVNSAKLDFGFKPNALVQSYINYYQGRGRVTMESGLRKSGRYMTLARRIFKEEGVPQDIAWLAQVESAWSPYARSWAAAVGLWQFIPGTGARFGLQQDSWVDERMSFEKATRASARYLKFLANRYAGNWELAMAAYNSGEGNVDRAIARSGYADFWEIYQRGLLPQETRNYVPNILATIIIAKNPQVYGFGQIKADPALAYDTVVVNNSVDAKLAADACDVSPEVIQALNPELKRGVTPPGIAHPLRVPVRCGKQLQATLKLIPPDKRTQWRLQTAQPEDSFETIARRTGVSEQTLSAINGGQIKPGQKVIVPIGTGGLRNVASVAPRAAAPGTTAATSSTVKIIAYTAKEGDTLSDVAAKYSTSARDLAALNRLSPTAKLRTGQVIKVQTKAK
jgi:membrane-bound lytic murein transglycosylase D